MRTHYHHTSRIPNVVCGPTLDGISEEDRISFRETVMDYRVVYYIIHTQPYPSLRDVRSMAEWCESQGVQKKHYEFRSRSGYAAFPLSAPEGVIKQFQAKVREIATFAANS